MPSNVVYLDNVIKTSLYGFLVGSEARSMVDVNYYRFWPLSVEFW